MSSSINIIFIGDIVGSLGRQAIAELLPKLRSKHKADLVIANGENVAHGKGITALTAQFLLDNGVDYITTGDHCFDQSPSIEACFNGNLPILRPQNYTDEAPGYGYTIIKIKDKEILLINLIGRSFMPKHHNCPFKAVDSILGSFTEKRFSAIIIDIHAETTAEKIALRHYLDGRISALLGTHTHVPTADSMITAKGTGYITDVGMTGDADGVIGVTALPIISSLITQTKIPHELRKSGRSQLCAVHLVIDAKNGHCLEINPIQKTINIGS